MSNSIIALPERVNLVPTALVFENGLSFEEWEDIGKKLRFMEGAVQWWIGDWLNYGERKFGEIYAQALDETDYAYQSLTGMKYVSSRVELLLRNNNLSWYHHKQIAPLLPSEQKKFLDLAEKENWSYRELSLHVKEYQLKGKQHESAFSWVKDPKIEAMQHGLEAVKEGVNILIRTNIDRKVADYLLEMTRKSLIRIVESIDGSLGPVEGTTIIDG